MNSANVGQIEMSLDDAIEDNAAVIFIEIDRYDHRASVGLAARSLGQMSLSVFDGQQAMELKGDSFIGSGRYNDWFLNQCRFTALKYVDKSQIDPLIIARGYLWLVASRIEVKLERRLARRAQELNNIKAALKSVKSRLRVERDKLPRKQSADQFFELSLESKISGLRLAEFDARRALSRGIKIGHVHRLEGGAVALSEISYANLTERGKWKIWLGEVHQPATRFDQDRTRKVNLPAAKIPALTPYPKVASFVRMSHSRRIEEAVRQAHVERMQFEIEQENAAMQFSDRTLVINLLNAESSNLTRRRDLMMKLHQEALRRNVQIESILRLSFDSILAYCSRKAYLKFSTDSECEIVFEDDNKRRTVPCG